MPIFDAFLRYINEKRLFDSSEKLLLAVSGGKDSVVLLDLCQRANLTIGIAHCNFGLRGEESDEDAVFVEKLAKQHQNPFHITRFDTKKVAKESGISTQMAARNLRYSWFDELRKGFGYAYLLTAHHLNDSLETVLLNLTHGTGLSGLRGILPKQHGIVRPLLGVSRKEIDEYAQKRGLAWREDYSNDSDDYQRNLLRHQVIPILQGLNPNLEKTFQQTAERLALAEIYLKNETTKTFIEQLPNGQAIVKLKELPQNDTASLFLYEILKNKGFSFLQCAEIWKHRQKSGKMFLTETHRVSIDRQQIFIESLGEKILEQQLIQPETQQLSWNGKYLKFSYEEVPSAITGVQYFDANRLEFPLCLRVWRKGDKFQPLGMKGRKKVSDFLIDRKIPLALKKDVLVLEDAEQEIIAVLGYALSEKVRITANTSKVWKWTYESNDKFGITIDEL